jgi:hypothetical protein
VTMQLKAMVIVFLIYILQFTGCGGDSSTAAGVIVATPAATSILPVLRNKLRYLLRLQLLL